MLESIQRWNLALIPIAVALGWLFGGIPFAGALLLGAAFGAANFWLTIRVVRRVYVPQPTVAGALLLVGKFAALLALVTVVVWWWRPNVQGFGLGFCTIVAAMLLKAMHELFRGRREEENDDSPGFE